MSARTILLVILSAGLLSSLAAKSTTDVVVLKNGDRLTGEIKKLSNGFLYFKADYMTETVQLDWNRVERLESKDEYTVSLANGARETGYIQRDSELDALAKGFTVRSPDTTMIVRTGDVVTITPVENTLLHQLTGSVNYGFTFTGGTNATQSTFSGDVAYRAERWTLKLDGASVINRQEGAENSGRNAANFYYFRYRGPRWFVAGTASFLNSEQQDLTARTTFGTGVGLDLIRRPSATLQVLGGALFLNEKYSPSSGSKSGRGADGQFLLQYSKYTFTKFQFIAETGVFPSLNNPGRVRMSVNSSVKRELFRNFNVVFSVYENFDSRPPVHAPKNDFGTSTSVGWTY